MRVLVVEDERVLGNAIATVLATSLDVEVDIAADGRAALKLAAKHDYALAVADFWVPPPTGLELLELWHDDERMGPVVIMSGTHDGPERNAALDAGASLFLEKPFSLSDLVEGARLLLRHTNLEEIGNRE